MNRMYQQHYQKLIDTKKRINMIVMVYRYSVMECTNDKTTI